MLSESPTVSVDALDFCRAGRSTVVPRRARQLDIDLILGLCSARSEDDTGIIAQLEELGRVRILRSTAKVTRILLKKRDPE